MYNTTEPLPVAEAIADAAAYYIGLLIDNDPEQARELLDARNDTYGFAVDDGVRLQLSECCIIEVIARANEIIADQEDTDADDLLAYTISLDELQAQEYT